MPIPAASSLLGARFPPNRPPTTASTCAPPRQLGRLNHPHPPLAIASGRAQSWTMDHHSYPNAFLRDFLTSVRTIAVVGASPRPHRPSHGVMRYLQRHGYRAIPVNPFAAGDTILGERCYAALNEIGEPVDMVDVFRRSEA